LLRRLWTGGDHLGWATAKSIFHGLRTSSTRKALESLGGSLVVETQGGMDESYILTPLGALVGERGAEFEQLLARFLAYEVARYNENYSVEEITREEVERDLGMSETELADLFRLVKLNPSFDNGGSGGPNWKVRVMKSIHDFTEVSDWPRFVREHALEGYDSALPVRSAARAEYATRQQVTREADADVPEFWRPDHFRLFVSHVGVHKGRASALEEALVPFNISCFVAHVDIEPAREWVDEIVAALRSADALVALLTSDFHGSRWTDQEVGFLMGRDKLVVAVQLDAVDPYGFMGLLQAISGASLESHELASALFAVLSKHVSTRGRIAQAVVAGLASSRTFTAVDENVALLEKLAHMDTDLAAHVRASYVSNSQMRLLGGSIQRAEAALARLGY
jgi:AraC-like DNA-binding protein